MKTIVASIIATRQSELDKRLRKIEGAVHVIQLDVMDGSFVPNGSLDFDIDLAESDYDVEAHLMVDNPTKWIEALADYVDTLIFHYESCEDDKQVNQLIELIHSKNKNAGIAINPETAVEKIEPFLEDLDQVLVMTVNPGAYGADFLPEMLEKVKKLKELKPDLYIEVDGGISDKTIKQASDAGADLFVSGSYLQNAEDTERAANKLLNLTN